MHVFHELRDRLRRWFGQGRLKNAKVRRVLLGGLFFALLTLIISGQTGPQRVDVEIGQPSPRDLMAPRDLENKLATKRKRDAAAASIPVLKKIDPDVRRGAENNIQSVFEEVYSVRGLPNQEINQKVEALAKGFRDRNVVALPNETLSGLLTVEEQVLSAARRDALSLVEVALSGRVAREDVNDLLARVEGEHGGFTLTIREPWLKVFIKDIVKSQIRANLVDDLQETERLRQKAADEIEPVTWKQGQIIIKKGEPVTDEQYRMLEDLRLVGPQADHRSLFGTAILAAVMVALVGLFLLRYRPDILERDSKLLLLGVIGILTLLLSLLMRAFQDDLGAGVVYLMPIAFNAMLVAILLDPKVALLQGVLLSVILAMATDVDQLNHAIVGIVGSIVAVYAVVRVESRTDIYRAGLLVSAANAVTILGLYLMQAYSLLDWSVWIDAGLGLANGIIVAVLVTGALPFFENLFGVVTPLKLLELSNPNHPLLKKLLVEAPGSYHHTILVANLCEAAAEAIGADQVLARVGAYYHDIGKTKRPYFFVENQFGGENPHDKLPPSLSALIITSHVKDGLEMAREARLPQEIIDFIPEHHGTTLVSYFYHMASKTGQAEYVLEEDFRYEGPKPRTKESAILMLADSCEASVRAIRQKGPLTIDQIEAQVMRIKEDRLNQGQLENCDLTLRDLDVIAKSFVKVLSGVHHARIDYPPEAARLPAPTGPAAQPPIEVKVDGHLDQQRAGADPGNGAAGGDRPPGGTADVPPGGNGPR